MSAEKKLRAGVDLTGALDLVLEPLNANPPNPEAN